MLTTLTATEKCDGCLSWVTLPHQRPPTHYLSRSNYGTWKEICQKRKIMPQMVARDIKNVKLCCVWQERRRTSAGRGQYCSVNSVVGLIWYIKASCPVKLSHTLPYVLSSVEVHNFKSSHKIINRVLHAATLRAPAGVFHLPARLWMTSYEKRVATLGVNPFLHDGQV